MNKLRYSVMAQYHTLEDRFNYLKLRGVVGQPTFGYERYINQTFYSSREWKRARDLVIIRDLGCDLGVFGWEIHERIYIHHMNPMTVDQIERGDPDILDPEFLITVTHKTHNAVHYGDPRLLPRPVIERRAGDTKLW